MTVGEVKARASSGAVLLMGRGVALQALGFLGNLALARLLVPEDFGIVAIGLTIVNVGRMLAGAGLGSALIGRTEPPARTELAALMGLQLLITGAVAAATGVVALTVGGDAPVTALMVLALPLITLRAPALLLFQRQLQFLAQLKVEIAETVVYLAVAITLAALGLGPWALAIGLLVRALTGTTVALSLSPGARVAPSLRVGALRPIMSFGWRSQATGVTQVGFDSALTAGIGAIAGLASLGVYSMAIRLLGIPRLLFESIWNVGFPAFARMMETDEADEVGPLLGRTVGTFAVAVAGILCPLVAASPALVPLLFGSDWSDVSLILPGAALALIVSGALGLATSAYFYARGDAATGLKQSVISDIVRVACTLPLLAPLGVAAIGIGWFAGALAGMAYTLPRVRRASGAHLGLRVARPAAAAAVAGAAGWVVAESLGVTVPSAAVSASVALLVWLACMLVVSRDALRDAIAMVTTILRSAFSSLPTRRRRRPAVVPTSIS